MGTRLAKAGIGLVLLATVGCGKGVTSGEASAAGGGEASEKTGTTELPDLSGQQVCDLLSKETLEKYAPKAESSNNTVVSTETRKQAICDSTALGGGESSRYLTIEVTAYVPTHVDQSRVEGGTAEEAAKEWLDSERANAKGLEDLEGVGDEAFTWFGQDADGMTDADAVFRSGIWGVKVNYRGMDRPNPDDRDNKVYLPKKVLIPALTEISAEIDGNLPALTGEADKPNTPAKPGEVTGDWLCTLLSDELIDRYLPNPETQARTDPPDEHGDTDADCGWSSSEPRTDSPGLRLRSGTVKVRVINLKPEDTFANDKRYAQDEYEEGPEPDGPGKGSTSTEPRDLPDLGLDAYVVFGHSGPESTNPSTTATVTILLPGNRIVDVHYGGGDAAELDTGTGDGDLGVAEAITDDEAEAGVMAMVGEVIPQLG